MLVLPNGVRHIPGYLTRNEQEELRDTIRELLKSAPLFRPIMPTTAKKMSVRTIPQKVQQVWEEFSNYPHPPEACLINFYDQKAKMGLHQDRTEEDFSAPVISISLGETCRFRAGEDVREGRTASLKVESGDIIIMGGKSRLCFHGVDRIYPDTSTLLKNGGRINLTLRRVTKPD